LTRACFIFQASNHVAAIDDPFVIASLLPPSIMLNANNLRWTLCASDRCFKNPAMSAFFRSVKVLPVSRGDGIYQKVYSPFSLLWMDVEVGICCGWMLRFDCVCWEGRVDLLLKRGANLTQTYTQIEIHRTEAKSYSFLRPYKNCIF